MHGELGQVVVSWTLAFWPTLLVWLPGEVTVGLATTFHEKASVWAEPVAASVMVRATAEVPVEVGVPVISPAAVMDRPAGSDDGESLQV